MKAQRATFFAIKLQYGYQAASDLIYSASLHTVQASLALTRNDAKNDWFCISDS